MSEPFEKHSSRSESSPPGASLTPADCGSGLSSAATYFFPPRFGAAAFVFGFTFGFSATIVPPLAALLLVPVLVAVAAVGLALVLVFGVAAFFTAIVAPPRGETS